MYNLQDKTYRGQPPRMSDEVTKALGAAMRRHSEEHDLEGVHVILHGGEPLLIGKDALVSWVHQIRRAFDSSPTRVLFSIQSNGTLVDEEWVSLLDSLDVRIGLSVDGPRKHHDRFRVTHAGKGSFDDTLSAIRMMRSSEAGRRVFSTVMAVVNPEISPQELFDFWQDIDVPGFDLCMPHANRVHPPDFPISDYGDWLIEFFDLWFRQNRPDRHIRYFDNMIRMLFEYPISTDNIGGRPVGVIVVETNGELELTDAFKCCAEGMTKSGLNVTKNEFSELHSIPMVRDLQVGAQSLCEQCQNCSAFRVCGGGYMPHRYGPDGTFRYPSIYCEALYRLAHHMRERVHSSMPTELREELTK